MVNGLYTEVMKKKEKAAKAQKSRFPSLGHPQRDAWNQSCCLPLRVPNSLPSWERDKHVAEIGLHCGISQQWSDPEDFLVRP